MPLRRHIYLSFSKIVSLDLLHCLQIFISVLFYSLHMYTDDQIIIFVNNHQIPITSIVHITCQIGSA